MTTKILAFAGAMGSGKDTAAAFVEEEHTGAGKSVGNFMFAGHLKQIAVDVFGCTHEEAFGDKKEVPFPYGPKVLGHSASNEIHKWVTDRNDEYKYECKEKLDNVVYINNSPKFETPRALLQFLGTEVLRDCYSPDYHLRQVEHQIETLKPDTVVITDARFDNERAWARKYGAELILLTGRTREKFEGTEFKKHASETGLGDASDYDYVIENTGSLDDLKNRVLSIAGRPNIH